MQHEDLGKFDVIIIGAGVPGALCALNLAAAGLSVCVAERAPFNKDGWQDTLKRARSTGRSVALMHDVVQNLKDFNALDGLANEDMICPLEILRIVDDSDFPHEPIKAEESFYAEEIGRPHFGYNIALEPLIYKLQECLTRHENIQFHDGAALEEIIFDSAHVTVRMKDGAEYQARLIVGADGRSSAVREAAHISMNWQDYDTLALTALIYHDGDHGNASTEFHRSGGPFTLVPLTNNRSTLVWCEKKADAEEFLALPKEQAMKSLQERSRGLVGTITDMSALHSWPIIAGQAESLTAPRTALIAEAAHILSPIGAQGLNLSLRDVRDLSAVIIDAARSGLDIGSLSVLKSYAKRRASDIELRNKGVDIFHRSVATQNPFIRQLRRMVLEGAAHTRPVRQALMHEAFGGR